MRLGDRGGFSLIEVLVAITLLATGLLVLAGGSLGVTRDLVRARKSTAAAALANAKLDQLRNAAASTNPACTSSQFASSGSAVVANGVSMTWSVSTSGVLRTVQVISTYSLPRGRTAVDTLTGLVGC